MEVEEVLIKVISINYFHKRILSNFKRFKLNPSPSHG